MCKCREAVNEKLAQHNVRIATGFTIDMLSNGPTAEMKLAPPQIALEKIDSKKRGRVTKHLVAAHCPFCGERYAD